MSTLEELRADLDRARGQWPRISRESGVDYSTLARVARGVIASPSIQTVEKIRAALDAKSLVSDR